MKTLNLIQGSPEWHAHRAASRNASEAPVLMGASSKMSRAELVRLRATGGEKEHSQFVTEVLFSRGHEVEPLLRDYAERVTGLEFYPVVGTSDDGYLSASFDGVTMDESVLFEAKQSNKAKLAAMEVGQFPDEDWWQVVHQFAVCESAERCLYAVGDGTDSGTRHIMVGRAAVLADIESLRAAWLQFDADVAAYTPEAARVEPVGRAPDALPALVVRLAGGVQESNLPAFKEAAIAVFKSIRTDLQSDQDFADAEKAVKFCGEVEDKLKLAKDAALAQTASIDELFRAIDSISSEARAKRLELERLVKARKDEIRAEIVNKARLEIADFLNTLNEGLSVPVAAPMTLSSELAGAIKGKKTVASVRDAAAQAVANAKIAASTQAARHRANLALLAAVGRPELFGDRVALVTDKATEDLQNLAKARVAAADALEQERMEKERERIRIEEEAKAKRQAEATAEQERQRIREEEQAKAKADQQAAWDAQRATDAKKREAVHPVNEQSGVVSTGATVMPTSRAEAAGVAPMSPRLAQNDPPPKAPETPAAVAVCDEAQQPPVAAVRPGATPKLMKLGDINARIAPLTVSAEGLAQLGFQPTSIERASKLYREDEFPDICRAIGRVLRVAIDAIEPRKAA